LRHASEGFSGWRRECGTGFLTVKVSTAADNWSNAVREIKGAQFPVVFSPDGREMVYGDEVGIGDGDDAERTGRLFRAEWENPDAQPAVLVSESWVRQLPCAWTRDGRILFWRDPDFSGSAISDGLELSAIPAAGGVITKLGVSTLIHDDVLAFSPKGDKLAIGAGDGREDWQGKRIAVTDPERWKPSYLTDDKTSAVSPSWSPDGERFAYSAAPGPTERYGVGGGDEARQLLAKRRIWLRNLTTMDAPTTLTADSRYRDEKPLWSADGKHILFCRMDASDRVTLWLMGAAGEDPAQVAGPLYSDPGDLGVDETWFGYYGYIHWGRMFDWLRG
jgi:dipeptidyl aminopeptidase/acylaminoacyl peptidase